MTLIKHEFINILSFSAKKNTLSVINFFLRSLLKNKRNHRAYVQKKKKQRLTEKRNQTWCDTIQGRVWQREVTAWLDLELDSGGSVSRCGVCPTIQDRVWPCERGTWLTEVLRWRWWPVGEGCGWLAFEDEDGGRRMWLAGVWRWRWWERKDEDGGRRMWLLTFEDTDGLISLQMWNCELWIVSWGSGSGARKRTAGAGVWMLGLRKVTRFFFVFIVPLKPNRFGSVGVFPVSGFW